MPWPPRKGELLPRFDEPLGIEIKLREYSLAPDHRGGSGKARDFFACLGLELSALHYLEGEIKKGISWTPVRSVRETSFGFHCAVQFPIAGTGRYSHRTAELRTAWELTHPAARPRMITAFPIGKKK
jgi:hypothetical protein